MSKVLFLILAVMSSIAFAQTSENKNPEAKKVDEFGFATIEHFEAMLDSFLQGEIQKEPSIHGYIINYGTEKEICRNETIIKRLLKRRKFDSARIVLLRGNFLDKSKTEFWIVPAGAKPPTPGFSKPKQRTI